MSTKIEWTQGDDGSAGETWNPVTGCTKVTLGCDHCYAETLHERFHGKGSFATVTLHPDRLDRPLHWRKPRRVFVNSMSDLFHDAIPDEFIARVFAMMAATPQHTYQVLTKRHGRMRSLLGADGQHLLEATGLDSPGPVSADAAARLYDAPWPLPNVWLGVSVEDQQRAALRIPALLDTPAAVRFLSCEPLLGPVDLVGDVDVGCEDVGPAITHEGFSTRTDYGTGTEWDCEHRVGIDWVIVGGESGPGARPMQIDWARSLVGQCREAEVACFVKQLGAAHGPGKGGDMNTWPADLRIREWPHQQVTT